jgi:FAD/FMN-containing dehydrogenase
MPRQFGVLRRLGRGAKRLGQVLLVLLGVTALVAAWGMHRTRIERPGGPPIVNDVTGLNPTAVARVLTPTTVAEIVAAVRDHPGPISIGGGRYSMGGQTATDAALHLDLRRFNRILAFSAAQKTITVQAGTRWRQIQEHIDPHGLAVKIMQTYANFTVGGSLSVNVHGRYVGLGPVILSVRSLRVVLADGSLVEASPTVNPEIFYGVIGGYGGLGVIVEATLDLADNVAVERHHRRMPIAQYRAWFTREIRDAPSAVFHNADIYPDEYTTVNAVTYHRSDAGVTVTDRLIPRNRSYGLNRAVYWMISELPGGKGIRQHVVDPLLFRGTQVTWRNYEASYDLAELEPASRERSTYLLQEYFVPVDRFDDFVPRLRDILRRNDVNVINVSIRHAKPDPGALLAWARTEVFAFVIYYKQGTDAAARERVGRWTRELVDAVVAMGGSYYLPYQPHATPEQFLRAYPRAPEFFALKQRLDPTNKFRNRLWDRYYAAGRDPMSEPLADSTRAGLERLPGYQRDEGQTFLTHPEWYIVYSSEEYADYIRDRLPTDFPYLSAIGQYWVQYREANVLTRRDYPVNWGYQIMLWVIGTSYSVELTLKGLYENTIGRLTGWTAGGALSDEDRFAHTVAADYGRFIHLKPWYEYRFAPKLALLWTELPLWGDRPVRSWERKLFLSAEYGIKALYATAIEMATRAAYVPEDQRIGMVVAGWTDSLAARYPAVQRVKPLDRVHTLVSVPRYDGFRDTMRDLARAEARITIAEIAGNDDIFLTGVAPKGWAYRGSPAIPVYALPVAIDSTRTRVGMRVPVRFLLPTLRGLEAEGRMTVDHVYDY